MIPFIVWKPDERKSVCIDTEGGNPLFVPSLMLGPLEQLSVFMLAHLLFAPLGDVAHSLPPLL